MIRIESVPELTRGPGLQCSFIGALEAVLKAHGEAYDYVDLMGLSGAAFRVRLARSSWDQIMGGRIHPAVSTDASFGPHADAVMAATGYKYQIAGRMGDGATGTGRLAETIRREIDAGRPLMGLNMHNGTCWGVVCGYDETSQTTAGGDTPPTWVLSRSTYDRPGADPTSPPLFPTDIWSIARAGEPPARVESVRASLRLAIELLATERAEVQRPGGWIWHYEPEYANGLAAYDAWVADLEDEPGVAALPPDQGLMYWQGNAVMYAQLLDARDAAASYLERVAATLRSGERLPLETAAATYRNMVAEMVTAWAAVPFKKGGYSHENGWLLREHRVEFLAESVPPYSENWTPGMRRRTIDALKAARNRDEEAFGLLQQAVGAQPDIPADADGPRS